MKTLLSLLLVALSFRLTVAVAAGQVNSGSNGSDGAFNPTANVEIDMADHPDGIYHYTSVNIPSGVTVTFKPNAANKPVVWLVQQNVLIGGVVSVNGSSSKGLAGAVGGPGGFKGGIGSSGADVFPGEGLGPGGGKVTATIGLYPGSGSFGTKGYNNGTQQYPSGETYGSMYLLPLIGGSGGGGSWYGDGTGLYNGGGGGGGGALLIATSGEIKISGELRSCGGDGSVQKTPYVYNQLLASGGGGSGGAIRLIAASVTGTGGIRTIGGLGLYGYNWGNQLANAGYGRIRIDAFSNTFSGSADLPISSGFQPIIIPTPNQAIQLNIASVGGTAISTSPNGVLVNPDVIISAQKTNPIPIVVHCSNIPLNTEITVKVQPANGTPVQAVGINNTGTLSASTATVLVNMPRGGGIIYASAVTGIAGTASTESGDQAQSIAQTGWTADGERFKAIEVTASLGGKQQVAYISESGKRYPLN